MIIGNYPVNVKLNVRLSNDWSAGLEAAQILSVPVQENPGNVSGFEVLPAVFIETDDALNAEHAPTTDGMYAVVVYEPAASDD